MQRNLEYLDQQVGGAGCQPHLTGCFSSPPRVSLSPPAIHPHPSRPSQQHPSSSILFLFLVWLLPSSASVGPLMARQKSHPPPPPTSGSASVWLFWGEFLGFWGTFQMLSWSSGGAAALEPRGLVPAGPGCPQGCPQGWHPLPRVSPVPGVAGDLWGPW